MFHRTEAITFEGKLKVSYNSQRKIYWQKIDQPEFVANELRASSSEALCLDSSFSARMTSSIVGVNSYVYCGNNYQSEADLK